MKNINRILKELIVRHLLSRLIRWDFSGRTIFKLKERRNKGLEKARVS